MENYIEVKVVSDDDGHWYVIPSELYNQFYIDMMDENLTNSGFFDKTYGNYRTGGDINLVKLYIKNQNE